MKFIKCSERLPPRDKPVLWKQFPQFVVSQSGFVIASLDSHGYIKVDRGSYKSDYLILKCFESWAELPEAE